MTILKRRNGMLAAGATAVAVVGLTAATFVTHTWTISPGGATTGTASSATVADTTTGNSLTCTSTLHTTFKAGTDLSGTKAGSVTGLSFSGCTVDGTTVTLTATNLPWALNLSSYSASKGTSSGTISGIHAKLAGPLGCAGVVDGTKANAHNGKVKVTYKNSTGVLTALPTGGNLHAYNVTSCFGVINSNDSVTLSAAYTMSPKQKITSP